MNKYMQNIILSAAVLLPVYGTSPAFAADDRKTNLSLAPFDTRNCDIALSKSVSQKAEQSLNGRIFGKGITLSDQNARGSFTLAGGATSADALYFEKLSDGAPDCIIVGRVEGSADNRGDNQNSKYRISVRLLGNRSDGVLLNFTSDWIRSSEFDKTTDLISEKVIERIESWSTGRAKKQAATPASESPSVKKIPYFSMSGCAPAGSFASVAKGGFGVSAGYGINDITSSFLGLDGIVFRGAAGLFLFTPNKNSVKSISAVALTLGTGRTFSSGMMSATPLVSGGFFFSTLKRTNTESPDGSKNYKTGHYADPLVSLSVECGIALSRATISVTPFYSVFFEKGYAGQFAGVSLGAGYGF
jgi:hypothetical protein